MERLEQTSVIAPKNTFVPPEIQLPLYILHQEKCLQEIYTHLLLSIIVDLQFGWSFFLLQPKGETLKLIWKLTLNCESFNIPNNDTRLPFSIFFLYYLYR